MTWLIVYAVGFLFSVGFLGGAKNDGDAPSGVEFLLALMWPVTLPIIVGFAVGRSAK